MFQKHPAEEPRCLVVEDDQAVLECLSTMLGAMGCSVETAPDGTSAIALLEERGAPDFILLDMSMPGMDGGGLLRWLESQRPDLLNRVVLMTGSFRGAAHTVWEHSHLPKLRKPMSWDALEGAVRGRVERGIRRSA